MAKNKFLHPIFGEIEYEITNCTVAAKFDGSKLTDEQLTIAVDCWFADDNSPFGWNERMRKAITAALNHDPNQPNHP
jgi:hypothetical protein